MLDQNTDSIKQINDKASSAAKSAVNQLMTLRNWAIGYYIVEYEQDGSDRAELFWSSNKKKAMHLAWLSFNVDK